MTEPATVVFFHAHPDDEAILTGGTMARLAAGGHRVVLVVATRGELGETPEGVLLPGQTLALRRTAETLWSADILGVARVEFLDYRDSGMAGTVDNNAPDAFCRASVQEAADRLAKIVDAESATALVIYDDHGGYGHPDHVQVHRVGTSAASTRPHLGLYEATMNRDHMRRGLEQLAAIDPTIAPPSLPDDFGEPETAITHAVDVRAFSSQKRRAMAAHTSQIAETSIFLSLPKPAFDQGFGFEWFIERRPDGAGVFTELTSVEPAAAT